MVVGEPLQRPWLLAGDVALALAVVALIYRCGLRERLLVRDRVLGPATNVTLTALTMPHDTDVQLRS